jgi:hypothetical protein
LILPSTAFAFQYSSLILMVLLPKVFMKNRYP